MARIDCLIDTHPMADEMKSVSRNIQGTTTAVIGMKAAVIKAEKDAADHVCDNVNKGFYTLIHSQISQKIAKLQSEVDSHIMKLNQLRKQLISIKDRMERDYGMISQRYIKLFNGLNKNLEQRVYELDRPIMEFAMKDINTISNRKKHMTATVPLSQEESLSVSQKILTSNMKFQGMRVIDSMARFLTDMKEQDELAKEIERLCKLDEINAENGSVITNMRHKSALIGAGEALNRSAEAIAAGMPTDLVSIDIALAIESLGEITGETVSESIVNDIFHNFCVGK